MKKIGRKWVCEWNVDVWGLGIAFGRGVEFYDMVIITPFGGLVFYRYAD